MVQITVPSVFNDFLNQFLFLFYREDLIKSEKFRTDIIVKKIYFKIETGSMASIESKEALAQGSAFTKHKGEAREASITANSGTKYDLIAKIVEGTGLTRKDAVAILQGIQPHVFAQFADNPEEFIIKACDIINDEKATVIIQHITYSKFSNR